ncbi:unnamed protein product [Symbiodinium sp. KB8]|nr:unnamed protein product [Symbiodinium sp. KB8]
MPSVPDDDEGLGSDGAEAEAAREEYEEFRRWLRMRNRGGSRYERQTRTTTRRFDDEDDDDGGGAEFRTNAGPPPSWDGVQCPFEDYLIRARIWISTTKARAQTRGPLLLKALSDTPFQDFKHLAKDPAWLADPGNAESLLKRMDSPEYYGDDQDEHLLASLARITYHLKRQKNETARQFLGRWEAAERKVAEHKVSLPSLYRGFLMINALGLNDGEIKTLLTFTHGSIEPKDVTTWLRKHETKLQAGQLGNEAANRGKSTPAAVHVVETATNETVEPSGEEEEIETMEAMLADLADDDESKEGPGVFEEDEAAEILAMMIKEKKKTYSQSAQIKKDKELGRGYRQGGGPSGSRDRYGPFRPGTYKLSIAELKQRTRCKRCNKVGHWHKECTNPPAPGHTRDPKETHLLEIDLEQYDDALFCHYLESAVSEDADEESDGAIDILSQSTEPNGCGKGRENFDKKHQESELDYMPGHHGEFEVLNLSEPAVAMDCSSPTNKRAREQPNPERANVIYIAWRNLVLRVAMFLRPVARLAMQVFNNSVDASLNHVQANLKELKPERLLALRDDVDEILMKQKDKEYELYMKYRDWKRTKKATAAASSPPGSYVVVKEEDDKSSMSGYSLTSEFTHYNTRTGSRGRRLATPSPTGGPPKGPPPPKPMWPEQPQPMSTSTRRSGNTTPQSASMRSGRTSSKMSSKATSKDVDEMAIKINAEKNAIVTEKMAQQEIFTQAYHIIEPNAPICACRRGCKVELSATTQNPSRVFYKCSAVEPTQQCGFFQWATEQPLLDDKYLETRQRVVQGFPRTLTARESLVRILQDACPHFSKVGTGSNAFYKRERCRVCNKLVTVERRQTMDTTAEENGDESDKEDFDATEFTAFLQWKKERY